MVGPENMPKPTTLPGEQTWDTLKAEGRVSAAVYAPHLLYPEYFGPGGGFTPEVDGMAIEKARSEQQGGTK